MSTPRPTSARTTPTEHAMSTTPWKRIKDPTPIPTPLSVETYDQLTDTELAQVIRTHLLPGPHTPKAQWEDLWHHLGTRHYDRTADILEDFLDQARQGTPADSTEEKRIRRFTEHLDQALNRIGPRPLAWAPQRARRYNAGARTDIESLVMAIARHRQALIDADLELTQHDKNLWAVLEYLGLDPHT